METDISEKNFNEIYNNPYYRKILDSCKIKVKASKEEIEQIKAIALWDAIKTYNPSKCQFNTWLTTCLRYAFLLFIKKEVRFKTRSIIRRRKIDSRLDEIPASLSDFFTNEEKDIIKMIYINKKSVAETCEALSLSHKKFFYYKKRIKKKCIKNLFL